MENSDLEYATKAARMLLHSYPNQPHDPDTFLRQLTIACTGKPKLLLQKMVDPRYGFIAEEKFPTLAELNEWFEKNNSSHYAPPPEHRVFLPAPTWEPPTAEEREHCANLWQKVKKQLEATAAEMRASGRIKGKSRPIPHRSSA